MFSFIVRRLAWAIPTIFLAISFLFLLFFVLPGDTANLIAGGANRTPTPRSSNVSASATDSTTRSGGSSPPTGGGFCAGTSGPRS